MPAAENPLNFKTFSIDREEHQVRVDGAPVKIGGRAFQLLLVLAERNGRVISKDELLERVWPGVVVEENTLQVHISTLRRLLGPEVIVTVPGLGYRFVAEPAPPPGGTPAAIPAPAAAAEAQAPPSATAVIPGPTPTVSPPAPAATAAPEPAAQRRPIAAPMLILAVIAALVGGFVLFPGLRGTPAGGGAAAPAATDAPPANAAAFVAPEHSIAVLPFVDLSEKKDQEYFSDGLSEALIDLLSRIPELRVPARTSSFYFKSKTEDITEIARKLRVAHVLEGSVRKDGNTIRVTAQLIRADNGYHLWSETYERNFTGVFKVQDEIAHNVVAALKLTMLPPAGAAEPPPANIEAYNLLLQGRFAAARATEKDVREAVERFEQSLKIDPDYAAAWAALGDAQHWLGDYIESRPEGTNALARAAANKALALNPRSAEAHLVLAEIAANFDFDIKSAAAEIAAAQALDPTNAHLLDLRGQYAARTGDPAAGSALLERALDRDPLNPQTWRYLALALIAQDRLADAERAMRKGLEISPKLTVGNFTLSWILQLRGQPDAAIAAAADETDDLFRRAGLANAYHAAGRQGESQAQLEALIAHHAEGGAYQVAQVYAAQGNRDEAIRWLERAYRQRDSGLWGLKIDAHLRSLHGDPRYESLLRRLGV